MKKPQDILVSIGIPTYNRAGGYLRQALQSAMAQDYESLEIIVSDNASTDNTESYVKSIDDRRIRYFRQSKNIAVNDNFNFCLQQAKGSYFLLLHDDDLIDASFISNCMDATEGRTDIGIIRTGTRLIDGDGRVLANNPNRSGGLSLSAFLKAWLTGKTVLYYCSTMFNVRGLKAIGGLHSPTNLFEDVVAELCMAAALGHADVTTVLASYRRHNANRGDAAKVMAWCEDCLFLLELMKTLVPEDKLGIQNLARQYFSRKCYLKATGIDHPVKRWSTYKRIYQCFDYAESPVTILRRFDYALLKKRIKSLQRGR